MKKIPGQSSGSSTIKKENGNFIEGSKARAFLGTARQPGALRGLAVKEFCKAYAVTQDTFTRLAGFSPRAVANWAQGQKPSASTERRLTELKRIFEALEKLVTQAAIGPWLKESNPAFDGSTPLQVIERGETDRIWRMIYELQSGEPG
jgi:DNA-binding transcriptional regulator YiaG